MPAKANNTKPAGKVISVQGPVVDVKFLKAEEVPSVFGVIKTHTIDNEEIVLEVAEHLPDNTARCIAINSTINLQRSAEAYVEGGSIEIQTGEGLYGRIINVLGQPIDDKKEDLKCRERFPIRKKDNSL